MCDLHSFNLFIMGAFTFTPIDAGTMAAQFASAGFNSLLGWSGSKLAYKQNKALQENAAQLQYDTWSQMAQNTRDWNEYNEKMSKMAEAGLNPLYSEGAAPQSSISAAAPGAQVSSPQMGEFDLASSITNALKSRELDISDRNVSANEKLSEALAAKAHAEEKTENEVRPYTIEQQIERVENLKLSNEEKAKTNANIDAELAIKRDQANAALEQAAAASIHAAVAQSANEWQESVAWKNANTAEQNANTQYYNFELAENQVLFEMEKYANESVRDYHRYVSDLKKNAIETLNEIRESCSRDIGPIHLRVPLDEIYRTSAEAKAINDFLNSGVATEEARNYGRKVLNQLYDYQSKIRSIGFPKDSKRPKFKVESGYNPMKE